MYLCYTEMLTEEDALMKFTQIIISIIFSLTLLTLSSCDDDSSTTNNTNNANNTNNTNNMNNINNTNNVNNVNNINNINNINNVNNTNVTNNSNNTNNTNNTTTTCVPDPDGYECSNCLDDDEDGFIDGMDPGCISSDDRVEGGFDTDIPGDDTNELTHDCWFDGNSGGGDDGCNVHVCCILDECPAEYSTGFDPASCETAVTQDCVDNCDPYVVPGCDCFGCCTICDGPDCYDIFIGAPRVSPDCTQDVIDDPALCPPCTLNEDCGAPCDPEGCILCPGQTEEDLPAHCTGEPVCPDEQQPCEGTIDCLTTEYCATGCCIPIPNVQ
jgi:hypothetical protein